MKLAIAESTVTIKTLSVNGKRMSKGIYNQLPRRSLLADGDCAVEGRGTWWTRSAATAPSTIRPTIDVDIP